MSSTRLHRGEKLKGMFQENHSISLEWCEEQGDETVPWDSGRDLREHSSWDNTAVELSVEVDERSCIVNDVGMTLFESLNRDSRLDDWSFYATPAGQVHLRFDKQIILLDKAYKYAQDTLWHALHEEWFDVQKQSYPFEPRCVLFGREEIDRHLGAAFQNQLPSNVRYYIWRLVDLRNQRAHPAETKTRVIDHLMRDAQSLACSLGDESHAMKIRSFRDKMQQQAVKVFEKISALAKVRNLPRAEALHHVELFSDISFALNAERTNEVEVAERFGLQVFRAWEQYESGKIQPDTNDTECSFDLEE